MDNMDGPRPRMLLQQKQGNGRGDPAFSTPAGEDVDLALMRIQEADSDMCYSKLKVVRRVGDVLENAA